MAKKEADRWDHLVDLIVEHTPLMQEFAMIIMEFCKEIQMDLDKHCPVDGHHPGDVCGYGFFSPCDFTITSLKVDDSYLKGAQSVQVIKFNLQEKDMQKRKIPFVFGHIDWETLFFAAESAEEFIQCDVSIQKDDVIGIIGHRENHNTPNGISGPYQTKIFEHDIELVRVTTSPNNISIPHTKEKNCEIGAGSSDGELGRIEMWYC